MTDVPLPPTEDRAARAVLTWAIAELEAAEIPWAVGDAQIIVAHALGLRRTDIQEGAADGVELTDEQVAQVRDFVRRRVTTREPLQLLTGRAFFRGLELEVGPGAYIPRRETEYVAQLALDAIASLDVERPVVIDVGAGVGPIALAIAAEVPASTVYAVELVDETFEWLARNCEAIAPANATAVHGDMLEVLPELFGHVDVLAGNSPWIPDGVKSPTPEVELWTVTEHLYGGGADGMNLMRGLSKRGQRWLKPGGVWVEEHGISQAPVIRAILEADGWLDVTSHVDPMGRERVTTARRP